MADQSHALASEQEARDVAEDARESEWAHPSFVKELFLGRFRPDLIHPFPASDNADAADAEAFLGKLAEFLGRYDADMVDRTGDIPEAYVQELREMGAFGMRIPEEYGGLGLDLVTYALAIAELTRGWMAVSGIVNGQYIVGGMIAAHGTDEQKAAYLPRLAAGEIRSCFSMTEPGAGSDVASLQTRADRDGDEWIINGQKVWTSGAHYCDYGIIITRTDPNVPKHAGLTMFFLSMKTPGVEVRQIGRAHV